MNERAPTQCEGCRSQIVIPARLASSRLPRKMLLSETGKPLIQHTYESARTARKPVGICVATDHEEIAAAVRRFGGQVVMTDVHASCGTDRVAEVARAMPQVDVFVNVQGDEPEISGPSIDLAIELLEHDSDAVMATLGTPIRDRKQLEDPNCVKVVCDRLQRAMYFSRSAIPHAREWDESLLTGDPPVYLQHVGLYAYRRSFLLRLAEMPAAPIEKIEKLEQLRVLWSGFAIHVAVVGEAAVGIDTWQDYRAFVSRATAR
ncbi:MAG: 3-deoxy-manno-octulosonate cytidylyltransferase [Planctomycetes bacterium]|nr:3-deoxy-manno-octulosonate cytidylyltransferase [Planctomycetota bacterium]